MLYTIIITSDTSAMISIGSDQAQDYCCEGKYTLKDKEGIIWATGKCDEDDINDFI